MSIHVKRHEQNVNRGAKTMRENVNRHIGCGMGTLYLLMSLGCSTGQPDYQSVKINVVPDGATLKVGNSQYTPPAEIRAPRNQKLRIEAAKGGYETVYKTVGYHWNKYGVMDMIGIIFIYPAIGVFFPGARSLDETDINITLKPNAGPTSAPNDATVATREQLPAMTPVQGTVLARFTVDVPEDTRGMDRTLENLNQKAMRKGNDLGYTGYSVFLVSMSMQSSYSADAKEWQMKMVGSFEVRK